MYFDWYCSKRARVWGSTLGRSGFDLDKTFQQLLTNLILTKSLISSCLEVPWTLLLKFCELKPRKMAGSVVLVCPSRTASTTGSKLGIRQTSHLLWRKKRIPEAAWSPVNLVGVLCCSGFREKSTLNFAGGVGSRYVSGGQFWLLALKLLKMCIPLLKMLSLNISVYSLENETGSLIMEQ